MAAMIDRLKGAWNAFVNEEQTHQTMQFDHGPTMTARSNASRMVSSGDRSVIASIRTRIAIDVAAITIKHVEINKNGWYQKDRNSGLNDCLTVQANIDQAARAFKQDMAMSLMEHGVIAVVPVDTTHDPTKESFDIKTMRVGTVRQWYARNVTVDLYNDRTGMHQEVTLPKESVAIIENPLYSVMNEPNSTLQRLIRKLHLLDVVDEQSSSGKMDLIIQLPYVIKSQARKEMAENRRKDIEAQLKGSQYGIAYAEATEKITQLNRPVENNLLKQVEYLTAMAYSELGLTEEVFRGTAEEQTMLNYHNRTIEPIMEAIVEEFRRKFLTKTALTQKQSVEFFREPFKLVSVGNVAEIADKFTRNEIMTSNEIRSVIGFRPSSDPKADELRNSNLSQSKEDMNAPPPPPPEDD